MTPSKLTQVCQEIIALGEKATKRPWGKACAVAGRYIHEDDVYEKLAACGPEHEEHTDHGYRDVQSDSLYLVSSANNAERIAKACLIMQEALEWYSKKPNHTTAHQTNDGKTMVLLGIYPDNPHFVAQETLQKVEELMG